MEFFTALKDTPVPTLLVIGGFIFLFLGIATIKKPIVIDVTPSSRKTALILGIILVGGGLYLLSQPALGQAESPPTETPTISVNPITETPFIGETTVTIHTPSVVYSQPEIVHLGDENLSGWAKTTGVCLNARIQVTLPVEEVTLSLETFGLSERAIIKVNDNEISVIPPSDTSQQEVWTENRSFQLLPNYFVNGYNILEICAVPLTKNASFAGEKDDFQIRNVQVRAR